MHSNESIVHFVPPDDDCSIIKNDIRSADFSLRPAASCDNNDNDMLQMIDLTLDGLKDSRQTTLSCASHVLVKEVERVNKRLAVYCSEYHSKRPKGEADEVDTAPEVLDSTRASGPDVDDCDCLMEELNVSSRRQKKNDETNFEEQDYTEAKSLMKQAHRVRRMALLLRSIDANQRLLFKELSACKSSVLMEQQENANLQRRND
jgi:hypothetical protein